jgi:hypothetical protein
MEKIHEPNDMFDFSKITLLSPSSVPGGNYFIKFRINDSPLYVQPPKCVTKSAIIKSGKKHYCDLMFTNENEQFVRWMENLEMYCQNKIFENRNKWFETQLDQHDIENSFTSPLKIFKSGKYYITRTNVPTILGKCSLKIYNEDENEVDIDILKENTHVVTILEIQGIKCSSKNFQIEIEIKQMMVMKQNNLFEKCIFNSKPTSGSQLEGTTMSDVHRSTMLDSERGTITTAVGSDSSAYPDTAPVDNKTNQTHGEEENISLEIIEEGTPSDIHVSVSDRDDEPYETENNVVISENTPSTTISQPAEKLSASTITEIPVDSGTNENHVNNDIPVHTVGDILEVDVDINNLVNEDTVFIKKRDDIYYQMYREAKRKAKMARDLAISSYLEAKHIKNTYMIENVDSDSDSDLDEDSFQNMK